MGQNAFFFHLEMPDAMSIDEHGTGLSNLEQAYSAARDAIPDLAAELLREGRNPMRCSFIICDATGEVLMKVPFTDLLSEEREKPHNRGSRPSESWTALH